MSRVQLKHGPDVGPGWHGHDPNRAMPCLGRTKMACLGLGRRSRAIWPSIGWSGDSREVVAVAEASAVGEVYFAQCGECNMFRRRWPVL
uniref:Uncharacterized protein n=1 Tax=Oryza sativa subsp. japonica TaxID=39947 RepID=Q84Z79_ORYSJ|nr:hypothetical protein [Oryza sativa Japonica Group]BAD10080.1 hypothetical protein [Oryza sativa Japonica Group]